MSGRQQKRIFVPTQSPTDWQRLLAEPDKHWKPGYSAHSLATCWESADSIPPEISALIRSHPDFSADAPSLVVGLPELKTELPGGGSASQTDLFAIVASSEKRIALGVEGKVAEPFGETLGEWLKNASAGKKERLAYLSQLLGLNTPLPPTIRYQLIHRTASALLEARRFRIPHAALIVHSFSPDHLWFDDFRNWCQVFGADASLGRLALLAEFQGTRLYAGWATGQVPGA
jgi:hypothetical protein